MVAILSNICFNNIGLLRFGQVRKFTLFIDFKNVLGVGMNQNPCRYCISSAFVFIYGDNCMF